MGATLQEMSHIYRGCVELEFLHLQRDDTSTETRKKFFSTLRRLMDNEAVAQNEDVNVGSTYYAVLKNNIKRAFPALSRDVFAQRDATCFFKVRILFHLFHEMDKFEDILKECGITKDWILAQKDKISLEAAKKPAFVYQRSPAVTAAFIPTLLLTNSLYSMYCTGLTPFTTDIYAALGKSYTQGCTPQHLTLIAACLIPITFIGVDSVYRGTTWCSHFMHSKEIDPMIQETINQVSQLVASPSTAPVGGLAN